MTSKTRRQGQSRGQGNRSRAGVWWGGDPVKISSRAAAGLCEDAGLDPRRKSHARRGAQLITVVRQVLGNHHPMSLALQGEARSSDHARVVSEGLGRADGLASWLDSLEADTSEIIDDDREILAAVRSQVARLSARLSCLALDLSREHSMGAPRKVARGITVRRLVAAFEQFASPECDDNDLAHFVESACNLGGVDYPKKRADLLVLLRPSE